MVRLISVFIFPSFLIAGQPVKLRGFPLEGKKTPFGVLSLISMRFIPQLKSWGFLAWIG
jgi:hypothetical protein